MNNEVRTKYMTFVRQDLIKRKTQRWVIKSNSTGYRLGTIEWFSRWRQYCFYPSYKTAFNHECLKDIINFIEKLREERAG